MKPSKMARGGYRSGAGRPKSRNWGGARPGAGRPRKSAIIEQIVADAPISVKRRAKRTGKLPLDYMLDVMNDPNVDIKRRTRMAIAALPFFHAKIGKKAQRL